METLEQQIEKLKAEHAFKAEIETLLGQYKPLAYLHKTKEYSKAVSIDLKNWPFEISNPLKDIVHILKPTNEIQVYDHKTKVTHFSPFRMSWNSNVQGADVSISYISNDINVSIKMPISFYKNLARTSYRSPNDCEDHYFGGYSRNEMQKVRIQVNQCLYYHNLAWYGGDYTTYIVDAEYREQFDNMVLTGELPLG